MKKTKTSAKKRTALLWSAIGVLAAACLVLAVLLAKAESAEKPSPSISLGGMEYRIENNRAVKRSDTAVKELRAFLEHEAETSGCPEARPGYGHVIAYTEDETQVFLRHGCGAADSPMHAVKTNGKWQSLSPTNQFNPFGIPDCKYVGQNGLSIQIAPVCEKGAGTIGGKAEYQIR